MNNYDFNDTYDRGYSVSSSRTFSVLMRKVYTWMALAMVITGMTAYYVATTPSMLQLIFGNQLVFWGLIIAEFALVFGISGMLNRISLGTATLMFIAYSIINGATLASIFKLYTMETLGTVFFVTAGMFGAMAFLGYVVKKDLSGLGRFFMMALIGLIIATVVNIFVHSTSLQIIISYIGVLLFAGLTAYDSQKIKYMMMTQNSVSEGAQKLALIGALSLYLDFINMFLFLLRIFGGGRD